MALGYSFTQLVQFIVGWFVCIAEKWRLGAKESGRRLSQRDGGVEPTVALLHEHAEAAAELAQRELMMEEDDDGDTLGSLGGSPSSQGGSRKNGRKNGQRSRGRSGR